MYNLRTVSTLHCPTMQLVPQDDNGHSYKLGKKRCSESRQLEMFSPRVVNAWNDLPEAVVSALSVDAFKGRLDAHWQQLLYVVDFPARGKLIVSPM